MVTRIKTPVAAAAEQVAPEQTRTSAEERAAIHAAMDEVLDRSPGLGRIIVSVIAGITATIGISVLGGWLCELMLTAALTLSVSATGAFILYSIGIWAAIIVAITAGWELGKWIVSGRADLVYESAKSTASRWYNNTTSWAQDRLDAWTPVESAK